MKKPSRSIYLLSALVALTLISAIQAQSPQNPFPISGPITITAPGYYRLTKNIIFSGMSGNIITIQQHNVTIDFNTFFIIGPNNKANTVVGVSANGFGNITIKNGTIAFCQTGVKFSGASSNINQLVDNMRISNCWQQGVYFPTSSPGSLVSNCLFSQIGGSTAAGATYTIAIWGVGGDVLAKNNVISTVTDASNGPNNSYGIAYGFSVGNTISNSYYGVYLGKYLQNLTSGCTVPFTPGTDVGHNN
jgi:hypothetical protein